MVVVDLITGFLGAGKTTFIHGYLHYLQRQGLKVRMIENEFGDVSVDTQLLQEEDCEITDLAGMCMCCVGKDAFIKMLRESALAGCDRIIVEPSGIYDVDEFFEVMSLPQIACVCEIGSILTIVDPQGMEYLTEEARYLMFAQLLASGVVLMSKTQWMSRAEIGVAKDQLDELMKERGCEAGLMADLWVKPWSKFDDENYEEMAEAGYSRYVHDREMFNHSEAFGSAAWIGHCFNEEDMRRRIDAAFESPACGRVYRIKGFLQDAEGQWYEVNCTSGTRSIRPSHVEDGVLVAIGQDLREKELKDIFSLKNVSYR